MTHPARLREPSTRAAGVFVFDDQQASTRVCRRPLRLDAHPLRPQPVYCACLASSGRRPASTGR